MATRIGDYDKAITDQSKDELLAIAKWLSGQKHQPFLVGGWAVYYFTHSGRRPSAKFGEFTFGKSKLGDSFGFEPLGSKDIDLVFRNSDSKNSFEFHYCKEFGYKKEGLHTPKRWVKHTAGTPPADIVLDFDVLSREWVVRGKRVTWKHLAKHHVAVSIAKGPTMNCPSKELLLLYKCVALVERTDTRQLPNQDLNYLDSKIWKDANDILALHDTGIDDKKLASVAKETGLGGILQDAKALITANYESYGFTQYAFKDKFLGMEKAGRG